MSAVTAVTAVAAASGLRSGLARAMFTGSSIDETASNGAVS